MDLDRLFLLFFFTLFTVVFLTYDFYDVPNELTSISLSFDSKSLIFCCKSVSSLFILKDFYILLSRCCYYKGDNPPTILPLLLRRLLPKISSVRGSVALNGDFFLVSVSVCSLSSSSSLSRMLLIAKI